jgi:putative FmdB family regulatory protein
MPLYEYHCDTCQQDFEKIVSFSQADKLPVCPVCQSQHTHKKISRVASFSTGGSSAVSSGSSCGSGGGRFS